MKIKLAKKEKKIGKILKEKSWILFIVFLYWVLAYIFAKLIFPFGVRISYNLLGLVEMWRALTDINFIFIGGIFFFIISWKIFLALLNLWVFLLNSTIKYYYKNIKIDLKENKNE